MPELIIDAWPQLGTDAIGLALYLRYRTHRDRHVAWPSYDDIKAATGLTRGKITAAIRKLENHGFLSRQKRYGASTMYRLHPPPVALPPQATASPLPPGLVEDLPVPHPLDSSPPPPGLQSPDRSTESKTYVSKTHRSNRGERIPPAVELLRHVFHRFPAKALYPRIDRMVGRDFSSLLRFGRLAKQWLSRGYNPSNIDGLLDAYRNGGLSQRSSGKPSEPRGYAGIRRAIAAAGPQEDSDD